jgi:hypothetical protein
MPEIPKTPKNNNRIVDAIENKLGPVGAGHHESHRRRALMKWLREQEKKGGKK